MMQQVCNNGKIFDKFCILFLAGSLVRRAQDGRWMHGGEYVWGRRKRQELAPLPGHAKIPSQ